MGVKVERHETDLSQLLDRVHLGEEIVLAESGRPVANIVPVRHVVERRVPGSARGLVTIGSDFDDVLPDGAIEPYE